MNETEDRIKRLLDEILPPSPGAMTGTEIARLAKQSGEQCSTPTLRYHLANIARDPYSIMERVPGKVGYRRRQRTTEGEELARLKDRLAAYKGVLDLIELEIATAKAIAREGAQ